MLVSQGGESLSLALSLSFSSVLCLERSLQHADSRNVCMRVSVCAATLYTQQLAGSMGLTGMHCECFPCYDMYSCALTENPPPHTHTHPCAHAPVWFFGLGRRFITQKWVSRWLILWKEFGQWGRLEGRRRVRRGMEGVPTNKPRGKEREREEEQMDE